MSMTLFRRTALELPLGGSALTRLVRPQRRARRPAATAVAAGGVAASNRLHRRGGGGGGLQQWQRGRHPLWIGLEVGAARAACQCACCPTPTWKRGQVCRLPASHPAGSQPPNTISWPAHTAATCHRG
jgi:hypothetical protein